MIIQVALILMVGFISIYFMLHRRSSRTQAGMKLFLLVFTVGAIISILYPNMLNVIANWLGVGRGADLMLYSLIVVFVFTVFNNYLEFRDKDALIAILARRVTLLEKDLEEAGLRPGPGARTAREESIDASDVARPADGSN